MSKTTISVVSFLVAVAIVGAYFFPQGHTVIQQIAGGTNTAGASFNTAKFAGVVATLTAPGSNATSSSVLNSDATDRYVSALRVGCQRVGTSNTAYSGTGLASVTVTVSTSSTAAPVAAGTAISALTISTSTATFVLASSTPAAGSGTYLYVWPTGSYLSFNTNATNTATCTFGADYFSS